MLLVPFVALSVLAGPAERLPESAPPSPVADVRLAQDEFGDPPPPPPPAVDDGELAPPPPPPPPGGDDASEPPRSKQRSADEDDDGEGEEGDGPGFFEKYFPLAFEEELHPAADEVLWSFWAFPFFGSIWLPMVLSDDGAPDGYVVDSLIAWGVHMAPHLVLSACNVAGMFAPVFCLFIPYIGPLLALPVLLANGACACLNLAGMAANLGYCLPVALANSFSRHAREAALGGEEVFLLRPRSDALALAMPY